MYKIIASGSTGNACLYHGSILVDCGVPFAALKDDYKAIKIVLLTHEHLDHLNLITLQKLAKLRPSIQFVCGQHLINKLTGIKNVTIVDVGKWYQIGLLAISPVKLYHDVENFGWRIDYMGFKIFHATDTVTLEGIEAKGYHFYALEHNYDEETIWETINHIESTGGFAHQRGAINSHLSEQQARRFFFENKGENSRLIRLHESKHN